MRMYIVTWECNGFTWGRTYYTDYHAEQFATALRHNGLSPTVTALG